MFKSSQFILVAVALFFSSFYNDLFWKKVAIIYPFDSENIWHFVSLFLVLSSIIYIMLSLVNFKYILKPVLVILLITTAITSYLMNRYGIAINNQTISNLFDAQIQKTPNLISIKLFVNLFFFGILPSVIVYFFKIEHKTFEKNLLIKFVGVFVAIAILGINIVSFDTFYSSFFKEHKMLTHYVNPTYYIYSLEEFLQNSLTNHNN